MTQTWILFTTLTLLVARSCIGDKSCTIWSSAGELVERDTTFEVYCTFRCQCRGFMYSEHPPTRQIHTELNETTVYVKVVNITKNRTYSCSCNCPPAQDPCGLDIFVGYSPDQPKNLECNYTVFSEESGEVLCTWDRGRTTYLSDKTDLWLKTVSESNRSEARPHRVSVNRESYLLTVPRSVRLIQVWVEVRNDLGSAVTPPILYNLSDIAAPSPPVLIRSACRSRECALTVKQQVLTQQLQIQFEAAHRTRTWRYPGQSLQNITVHNVSSLEPNTLYRFKARSRFGTGVWSEWSSSLSSTTQEEAPAEMLDLWFAESDSKFPRVYWKEPDVLTARGKIRGYRVRVYSPVTGLDLVTNFSSDARNYSVPACDSCEVTVWAHNSEGSSPPATIAPLHSKVPARSSRDVQVTAGRHGVALSWPKPETAVASYVVEWYPEGEKLEELQWLRVNGSDNRAAITGIEPMQCYEGAVYFYHDGASVHRKVFSGVSILEAAPEAAPLLHETVEGDTVRVSWSELPRAKRRGCITNYTIYLENVDGRTQRYSATPSERSYLIRQLPSGIYDLWMTAFTAEGEGPASHKQRFPIQEGTLLINLLVCIVFSLLVVNACLCMFCNINQKLLVLFHCLMLDVVPDPANSKWAKEYVGEKGKMNFQLQMGSSSEEEEGGGEEEEPILVEVEELPRDTEGNLTSTDVSAQLGSQIAAPYPVTTYIKSLSQDSSGSEQTHTSQGTETTVEYISSHGLGDMEEEEQEEEEMEEEEEEQVLSFFPSHNRIFAGSIGFGGKLTLDGVKVDLCRDFFQEQHEGAD